jgi:hypothetical protein
MKPKEVDMSRQGSPTHAIRPVGSLHLTTAWFATFLLAVLLGGVPSYARTAAGGPGADLLRGTSGKDRLLGRGATIAYSVVAVATGSLAGAATTGWPAAAATIAWRASRAGTGFPGALARID